jgi:voltage-gated sodium channel
MGYVALLLFVLFYVYAVAGTFLFGANDPVHFGSLQLSFLSLFQIVTLEGWTEILHIQMEGCAGYGYDGKEALCVASSSQPIVACVYFISFILLGTMVMLNLFIGVIMNGMTEAQTERDDAERELERHGGPPTLADELHLLTTQLQEMQGQVARVARRAAQLPAEQASAGSAGSAEPPANVLP